MTDKEIKCPSCESTKVAKNGRTGNKQKYRCSSCGKNFSVELPPLTAKTDFPSTPRPGQSKAKATVEKTTPPAEEKTVTEKKETETTEPAKKTRSKYDLAATIKVLVDKNPKRGTARGRFDLYKEGMTVREYLKAGGLTRDLRADLDWKHIELISPVKAQGGDEA